MAEKDSSTSVAPDNVPPTMTGFDRSIFTAVSAAGTASLFTVTLGSLRTRGGDPMPTKASTMAMTSSPSAVARCVIARAGGVSTSLAGSSSTGRTCEATAPTAWPAMVGRTGADIGRGRELGARRLLGGHIGRRPEDLASSGHLRRRAGEHLGDAEVGDLECS